MRWILTALLLLIFTQISVAPVKDQGTHLDEMLAAQEYHGRQQLMAKIDTADFDTLIFLRALHLYVENPEIVYAQAKLETGWFKSPLFLKHNNPFGMKYATKRESTAVYRARIGRIRNYAGYNHWSDAVKDVALWQQYWREQEKLQDDYYQFLQDLPYATAKRYVKTVKLMVI